MEFLKVKSILTKVNYGSKWYGVDYCINLYRGCCHGCIYCDSRSECYHIDHFEVITSKEKALTILEQELSRKRNSGIVGMGSMSDPYHPLEQQYQLTRGALKLLARYHYGVSIDTKSDLVLRDLDILLEIQKHQPVLVKFTITTPNDALAKVIEPNVCVSSKRLQAMKKLSNRGIFVGVMLNPVLPFITDSEEDIKTLVQIAFFHGAKFIHTYMGMTLRDRQRTYYYQQLDCHFKGLKKQYIQTFGRQYFCPPPNCQHLYQVFTKECEKYGLLYRMEDIIAAFKEKNGVMKQMTFFEE